MVKSTQLHKYDWRNVPEELLSLFSHELDPIIKAKFMQEAIKEARRSYQPLPDGALCGAVIVKDNKIIGRGHRKVLYPTEEGKTRIIHAEQGAIYEAGENAKGAELYVTLEPCYERGHQSWHEIHPPCSMLIPKAGIERVIFGLVDMNPKTFGKGLKQLVEAGVKVESCYEGVEKKLLELIGSGKFYTLKPMFESLEQKETCSEQTGYR